MGARRACRALRHRRPTGDELSILGLRGGRRRHAALLAPARWRVAGAALRSLAAARARRAGAPCELERSAALLPLGQAPLAERNGVAIRQLADAMGRGVGMDGEHVCAVPGLQRRSVRRLLAAVVPYAQGAEGRELRDARAREERALPQFLSARARRRLRWFSHL